MKDLEKLRKEIQKLNTQVFDAISYLKDNEFIDDETKANIQAKIDENKENAKNLLINFNKTVAKGGNKISEFVDFHKKIIQKIKNFHTIQLTDNQKYTKERLAIMDEITEGWNNFENTGILPDTYKIEEYELFVEIAKFENSIDIKNISYERIAELEKIRQDIMTLSRMQFENDTILDKGEAWGASKETIDKAQKDYRLVADELSENDFKLRTLISETDKNILHQWILFHLYTCADIINIMSVEKGEYDSTRLMVADETFYEWKNILSQDKKYVIPNVYYLRDYDKFFNFVFNNLKFTDTF